MKKLNILMLGSSYKMGLTHYLALYAIGLKHRGHSVIVLSSPGEQVSGLLDELKRENIKCYRSSFIDKKDPRNIYRASKEIAFLQKSENIDVIHANGFYHMVESYLAQKLTNVEKKIAVVFMVHSICHGTKHEQRTCIIGSKLMNRCADLVMPVSEWERLRLIESGLNSTKAITVHNAIDFKKFDLQMTHQNYTEIPGVHASIFAGKTIAYLAELIPRKGIDYLLRSVPQVLEVFPEVAFLIIGGGPLREELEMKAVKLGIDKNIYFTGRLHNRYIPAILSNIDVGVIPSLSETFGHTIIEPMAAGKPVISTPVGVAPEIIKNGETGFIVPPKDPHALAEAIISILSDKEKAKHMGTQARKVVEERFNIEAVARNFEKAYEFAIQKAYTA